jgi:hypothetical protein
MLSWRETRREQTSMAQSPEETLESTRTQLGQLVVAAGEPVEPIDVAHAPAHLQLMGAARRAEAATTADQG